jgi:integrase
MLNRRNDYAACSNFFNWCKANEYCAVSPMDKIGAIKIEGCEPVALSLGDSVKLLRAARDYKGGVILPYVVLGMLCGIRPKEISRLTWDDIRFDLPQDVSEEETATVIISGKVAKVRGRRVVHVSANATAFLMRHVIRKTPFVGVNWRRDFHAVRKLAQPSAWEPDILRHTAISNHLAAFENESKTAAWAGNSPDVCHRSYKGLVRKKDAELFWTVTPDSLDAVPVELHKAA